MSSLFSRILLGLLLFSPTLAAAQIIIQPPTSGGVVANPFLAPSGCVTPPYSFSVRVADGLCKPGDFQVQLQSNFNNSSRIAYLNLDATSDGGFFTLRSDEGGLNVQIQGGGGALNTITEDGSQNVFTTQNNQKFGTNSTLGFAQDFGFNLEGSTASNLFLSFINVASPTKSVKFTQSSSTPSLDVVVAATATRQTSLNLGGFTAGLTFVDAFGNVRKLEVNSSGISGTLPGSTFNFGTVFNSSVPFQAPDGTAAAPGFVFADVNAGIAYDNGINELIFASEGAQKFRIGINGPDWVDVGTKPTCDEDARGVVFFDEGGVGVADTFEVCAKDSADVYDWRVLAVIP